MAKEHPGEDKISRLASVGLLTAGIAHEISSPIGFIKTNTNYLLKILNELAKNQKDNQDVLECIEDFQEVLQDNLQGIESIERLIKELKSFSRPKDQWVVVDLEEVVESSLLLSWNFVKRVKHIEKNFRQSLPVYGNPGKLQEVIINLLVNASDAVVEANRVDGGRIKISIYSMDSHSCIEIEDNGTGIKQGHLKKIFSPFFTTKGERGTGLGLYLVQKIVKEHNGTIDVSSTVGKGTKFIVCLPAVDDNKKQINS